MSNTKTMNDAYLALGEPIAPDFSDYARKIRNNLIVIGVISTVLTTQNVLLDPKSAFLGLQFVNVQTDLIFKILFFLTIYFLVHFVWIAWDHYLAWELRLTGTHTEHKGVFSNGIEDTSNDLSQTTLYYWWETKAKRMEKQHVNVQKLIDELEAFKLKYQEGSITDGKAPSLNELSKNLSDLKKSYSEYTETVSDIRIPASLERFDKRFHYFNNSQSWRWLGLELMLPVGVGIIAIGNLWLKIWG